MKQLALSIPQFGTIHGAGGIPEGGSTQVQNVLQYGVTLILVLAALLAVGFLIYGGIRWISSGGEKGSLESARKIITYSVIGLLVIFLSFFIVNSIGWFFGVNLLGVAPPPPGPVVQTNTCTSNGGTCKSGCSFGENADPSFTCRFSNQVCCFGSGGRF